MKRISCLSFIYFLTLTTLISLISPTVSFAAEFQQAYIRLDKTTATSPLSGLVCATPATNATEAKVSLQFPSSFSIQSSTGSWTTDTADIPAGTTAWSGIGASATTVSGNTVTFASNNLTVGTKYCFTFSGSGSTTGSIGNTTGNLSTKTSGNAVIDSSDIGFYLVQNDQVSITARVKPLPTDFQAILTRLNSHTIVPQKENMDYQITYGSHLPYATTLTVTASWTLGTIEGTGIPSVDTLSYVNNSAGDAYGGAKPIIDLTNRTITWTIPNFPANKTDQKVYFSLITTENYTNPLLDVDFSVTANTGNAEATSVDSTVTGIYRYQVPPPGPTSTPGPQPTPLPPKPKPPLYINGVGITSISPTDATIAITSNFDTSYAISYGTDPKSLTKHLTSLDRTKYHEIHLTDLTPGTQYYFVVVVTDESGRRTGTNIYTFTSAKESKAPQVAKNSLIATSNHIILSSSLADTSTVVIPESTPYEIQFSLVDRPIIKSMRIFTRNKNVLGITSIAEASEPLDDASVMLEVKPGVFDARLMSPERGQYELFARIEDYNGNISEEKIGNLRVTTPFMILEKGTNKPIEHARVSLSLYNPTSKMYETISPQSLAIQNPAYSEPDGSVKLVLPQGQYRAAIDNLRSEKQTVDFTIGPYAGQDYPTVYLATAPFSFGKTVQYIVQTCSDVLSSSELFLMLLGSSGRFLELNILTILACFVILSVFALSGRLRVPVHHLPVYFAHLLFIHPKTGMEQKLLSGQVIDHDTDRPLSGADIFVLDASSGQILLHTMTNRLGKFSFPLLPVFTYKIEIAKQFYHEGHFTVHEDDVTKMKKFSLVQHGTPLSLGQYIASTTESVLGMSFELLLLLSFILCIILGYSFGFPKVLPFLVLSGINLAFWILHRKMVNG